uniref:Uncharacterized protein n=1 Tax=viral metagenome TaxID=1070528 RepID=A0A6C0KUF2_9ZZZZ
MFAKHVANIIMATAMISVFLGVFFFTYASSVEQKIVVQRSTEIVDDMVLTAKNAIPQSQKTVIMNEIVPYLVVPKSLEEEDAKVAAANKELMVTAAKAIGIFVFFCCILLTLLTIFFKVPIIELLKDNFIILIFVGLTEFTFLTYFAENYVTIDANYVKGKILESLITFGSQTNA